MSLLNSHARFLVIEDNPGDFVLIQEHLLDKINSAKVTRALNFKAASECLKTGQVFDIVLLDLSLPDKTGEALIKEITELTGNIPVIVLTGHTEFAFGVKSLALGVSDYLLKDDLSSSSLYKSIVYSIERKRIAIALEESEKKYSEMFQLSPLPMWVMQPDTFQFLDANKAAVKHYGYSFTEFLAMTMQDLMPADDHINIDLEHLDDQDRLKKSFFGISRHIKKDGIVIKVDTQSNIIKYKGESAWMILANDITERYNYIKAIEEQNGRLKEIAWLQSHVVRAPLARIMGLIQLLQEASVAAEEKSEMMTYLLQSANELDEVIKDISNKTRAVKY